MDFPPATIYPNHSCKVTNSVLFAFLLKIHTLPPPTHTSKPHKLLASGLSKYMVDFSDFFLFVCVLGVVKGGRQHKRWKPEMYGSKRALQEEILG